MELNNKVLYDVSTSADWETKGEIDYHDSDWYKRIARQNIGAYKDKTSIGGIPYDDLAYDIQESLNKADAAVQNVNAYETPAQKIGGIVTIPSAADSNWGVVKLASGMESVTDTVPTSKILNDAVNGLSATVDESIAELSAAMHARAVFMTSAEWQTQSATSGDSSKIYYVGPKGKGKDKYDAYEWNDATSAYIMTDEATISLDGYWYGNPSATGTTTTAAFVTNIAKDSSDKVTYTVYSGTVGSTSKPVYFKNGIPTEANTIPAANNGKLTITKNNHAWVTFSANQSGNTSADLGFATTADPGLVKSSNLPQNPELSDKLVKINVSADGVMSTYVPNEVVYVTESTSYDDIVSGLNNKKWPIFRRHVSIGGNEFLYMPMYYHWSYTKTIIFRGFEQANTFLTKCCKKDDEGHTVWEDLQEYNLFHTDTDTINVTNVESGGIYTQKMDVKLKDGGGLSADTDGLYISDNTAIEYVTTDNTFADVQAIIEGGEKLPVLKVDTIPTGPAGYYRDRFVISSYHYSGSQGKSASFSRAKGNIIITYTIDGNTNQWTTTTTNVNYATYGANGTDIEAYFTANTQNIIDINTALNNKQPLCNMYIDGTNTSTGTAYTDTVNAISKGYAPMLNVGSIYLPLAYVSTDPNDSNVLWYHFEDFVSSNNTVYHRIVKPSSITNSDTTGIIGTDSEYAQKIGRSTYHPRIGGPYQPVYVTNQGIVTECSYKFAFGEWGTDPNTVYFL